jgi:3-hydroxybutyryl-CoA dehydrogenase
MPEVQRIGVCGNGLMGSGIAQVAATSGYDVVVLEADKAALDPKTAEAIWGAE